MPEQSETLAVMARDIKFLTEAVAELKNRPPSCHRDGEIQVLQGRQKWLSGILAAIALVLLGSLSVVLTTCEKQSHTEGVTVTQIKANSDKIIAIEKSLTDLNKAREQDTLRIIEEIRNGTNNRQ